MAEYDIDKNGWTSNNIKGLDLPIFPFSSISYCSEMNTYFILGGYNNKVEHKTAFCSRALKISEHQLNVFESIYTA